MLGSPLLDIGIGLIFVYLLLSFICSAIQEMIEAVLKKRAVDLERGIREMLQDPNGKGLVKQLYDHPLINGLYKGTYDNKKIPAAKTGLPKNYPRGSNLPSYIPSRSFALAIMDIVLPATPASPSGAHGATADSVATPGAPPPAPLQPLRDAAVKITNPAVNTALTALIDAAAGDVSKARENIEGWFNTTMDRVSGWYKRRAQTVLLVLGFLVAVAINADTVSIATVISRDKDVRNALVAAASEYAKKQPNDAAVDPEKRVEATVKQISNLGLPVGWSSGNSMACPDTVVGWLMKLLGWTITAAAVSLGAPFWFDLLNKFMVIRSTVKPHEKSLEEGSRD